VCGLARGVVDRRVGRGLGAGNARQRASGDVFRREGIFAQGKEGLAALGPPHHGRADGGSNLFLEHPGFRSPRPAPFRLHPG